MIWYLASSYGKKIACRCFSEYQNFFSLSENLKAFTPTAISPLIHTSFSTRHTSFYTIQCGAASTVDSKNTKCKITPAGITWFLCTHWCKFLAIVIGYFQNPTHVTYQALRTIYYTMSNSNSGGSEGRGFGLQNRTRCTPLRQQPTGNKWTKITNSKQSNNAVTMLDGPAPPTREKVERQFTMYVCLALGHPRKSTPQKVDLLHHLFSFIREVDNTAAIQPYMKDDPVNSVCHPAHILDKISDFEHYFPELKYYHRRIRTKCRLTTSIDIKTIKQKMFLQTASK